MKRQIDCYGFESTSEFYRRRVLPTHLAKTVDGVIYECFSDAPLRPIHRLDVAPDGSYRVTWAYGAWADADALEYIPLDRPRLVDAPGEDG